jgi:hypothetical protein
MASWRSVWRVMFSKKYPIARLMDSMSPVGVMTPSSTSARMTPLVSFLQGIIKQDVMSGVPSCGGRMDMP